LCGHGSSSATDLSKASPDLNNRRWAAGLRSFGTSCGARLPVRPHQLRQRLTGFAQGDLEVSAEVSAKNLARVVACGQVAKVKIIGVGELPGWIRFVSTTVDPMTQQGEARVFVGANPALRTGTFARAIVTLGRSCGIAIPLSGVLYGKEGPVVQVVRGERVQTRAITTGPTFDGKVQVTKGLAEGDVVVMRAGAFLRDGDPVRPVLADDTSAGK
jgi:HlyD family secretion protein